MAFFQTSEVQFHWLSSIGQPHGVEERGGGCMRIGLNFIQPIGIKVVTLERFLMT